MHCLTFISEVSCWLNNAHMFLWLSAFSGWGVWQSRAPGGERGITGIQHCSHSGDGSLLVTLWMRQQPVNMNKLNVPGNVPSCSACCRVPHSATLSSREKDWNKWSCIHGGFERLASMQTGPKTPEKPVQLVSLHRQQQWLCTLKDVLRTDKKIFLIFILVNISRSVFWIFRGKQLFRYLNYCVWIVYIILRSLSFPLSLYISKCKMSQRLFSHENVSFTFWHCITGFPE